MISAKAQRFVCIGIVLCFWACTGNNNKLKLTEPGPKLSANDPFKNTMIPSQEFTINGNMAEIVEGNEGIRIVTQPGSFIDKEGNELTGEVKLELAEGLKLEDMILSNLTTTTTDGKSLQSGGMFYINASSEGETVFINPAKPIYMEVPTDKKVPGMQLYTGVRDEKGNMTWANPQPMQTYLVPVDLDLLDFLPEGFEMAVHAGMPFRNYKEATKELVDSLYYSLAIRNIIEDDIRPAEGPTLDDINYEPHYTSSLAEDEHGGHDVLELDSIAYAGIDPAGIKVLKDPKYQGTYISTREFEKRLRSIFKTCRNELISIYIKHLDKNLWEADRAAADLLGEENEWYKTFNSYADEKLTNVKDMPPFLKNLASFYERKLKSVKQRLSDNFRKEQKQQAKAERKIARALSEYKKILEERETYRMETYGFTLTETGWINIDKGTAEKPWKNQELNIVIQNTQTFSQVYTYVFYESIKSLYRLNSTDNKTFFVGGQEGREMPVMKNDPLTFISVAYVGEEIYYEVKRFDLPPQQDVEMVLQKGDKATFKQILKQYDKQGRENSISVDLRYMQEFATERIRQQRLIEEALFIQELYDVAFACCNKTDGKELFNHNCAPCHHLNIQLVGPALAGVTKKHPFA